MIRRRAFLFAAIAVIALITPASEAYGAPINEVGIDYYDQCLIETGWELSTCGGQFYSGGTSSGAKYKNEWKDRCDGTGYSSKWYQWNGSSWVLLSGYPGIDPGCS